MPFPLGEHSVAVNAVTYSPIKIFLPHQRQLQESPVVSVLDLPQPHFLCKHKNFFHYRRSRSARFLQPPGEAFWHNRISYRWECLEINVNGDPTDTRTPDGSQVPPPGFLPSPTYRSAPSGSVTPTADQSAQTRSYNFTCAIQGKRCSA